MKKLLLKISLALLVSTMTVQVCYFNISEVSAKETIKLSKTHLKLYTKQSTNLKVLNTKAKVKWSSSNNKIASVTSKGKVTAKKKGAAYIYAKVNNKTFKCKVSVLVKQQSKKKVQKVILNKYNVTLKWGQTFQLRVGVSPSNAISKKIKFTSSNPAVATINSKGMIQTNNIGTTTLTATAYNGVKASCTVRVVNPHYIPFHVKFHF